jgi:integrase
MARHALTDKLVQALTSNSKPQNDHFDTISPGLALRVSASGKKVWTFNFTNPADKKRARITLGTYSDAFGLKVARTAANAHRATVDEGKDPRVTSAPPAVKTVADLIDDRIARHLRHSSRRYNRTCLDVERVYDNAVIPARCTDGLYETIGQVPITEFRGKHLRDILRPIEDRGRFGAAKDTASHMKALFNFAVEEDMLTYNPIQRVKPPKRSSNGEEKELRSLSPAETRTVWNLFPSVFAECAHVSTILRLMLATGQRVGEVAGMRKSELNLKANRPYWTIPADRVKNKKGKHVVPLNSIALELIREASMEADDDVLFPNAHGESLLGKVVIRAVARAHKRGQRTTHCGFGMERWTTHDLRRTVSNLPSVRSLNMPVADRYMDHVLNHRSATKNTVRKRHYNPHDFFDEKADALDEWGEFLSRLVADNIDMKLAAELSCPRFG